MTRHRLSILATEHEGFIEVGKALVLGHNAAVAEHERVLSKLRAEHIADTAELEDRHTAAVAAVVYERKGKLASSKSESGAALLAAVAHQLDTVSNWSRQWNLARAAGAIGGL